MSFSSPTRSQLFHAQAYFGSGPPPLSSIRHAHTAPTTSPPCPLSLSVASVPVAANSAPQTSAPAAQLRYVVAAHRSCTVPHAVALGSPDAAAADVTTSSAKTETIPTPSSVSSSPCAGTVQENSRPRTHTPAEVFMCQEESLFYSQTLEKLLPIVEERQAQRHAVAHPTESQRDDTDRSARSSSPATGDSDKVLSGASQGPPPPTGSQPLLLMVVEFGCGDGQPVINALAKTEFDGVVYGFELNPTSADLARKNALTFGLSDKYQVSTGCFYQGISSPTSPAADAACLIANPPYLPAPDADILLPELHGGEDGAGLTRDLLSLNFPYAVLLVSSYSNPASVLQHAAAAGYRVVDFLVTPMPFGTYSSQPKVRNWIADMRARGQAFYSGNVYLLAGVLFEKMSLRGVKTSPPSGGSNSNGNGNGKTGDNVTLYHNVTVNAEESGDMSPQLLRLLTAL